MIQTRSLGARLLATILALTFLTAVSWASSGAEAEGGGGALEGKTIAFLGYADSHPWGSAYNETFYDALAGTGVTIKDLTSRSVNDQILNFNQAIFQKPDLIVALLWSTKAAVPSIKKAELAGIPVLIVDGRPAPVVADDVMMLVSDNTQLGRFAARNIIEGLKAQGRDSGNIIAITGSQSMLITQDRMNGFRQVMNTAPQYNVIGVQDGNWDPVLTGKIARQMLAKYGCGGIQAAYGMADYMAVAVAQAAKQAGCAIGGKNGLIITGSNCGPAGIKAIKAGVLYGTATEDPPTIAKRTARYIKRYLNGKNPPHKVVMQEYRITADNVDQFAAQCTY